MSLADFWYRFKTLRLSKPAGDRPLFAVVKDHRVTSILEVGIGNIERTEKLICWLDHLGEKPAKYAAIDLFESAVPPHLGLKEVFKRVSKLGIRPWLVPGSLATGGLRVLHTIGSCDLVVIDDPHLSLTDVQVTSILAKLIHEGSIVMSRNATGRMVQLPTANWTTHQLRRAA
jgi:hypothetical protein